MKIYYLAFLVGCWTLIFLGKNQGFSMVILASEESISLSYSSTERPLIFFVLWRLLHPQNPWCSSSLTLFLSSVSFSDSPFRLLHFLGSV